MVFYSYDQEDIIIPSQDELYMRIPKKKYWELIRSMGVEVEDYIPPKIFQPVENGLSVEWERYCIALWTQARNDHPENYGVLSMTAGDVREIPLDIDYSPNDDNMSHTDILMPLEGVEKTWARNALSDISEIIISVPTE